MRVGDRWGNWKARGTLSMGVCMCATHNSGNYLSCGVHTGLGRIGSDGGGCGGVEEKGTGSQTVI